MLCAAADNAVAVRAESQRANELGVGVYRADQLAGGGAPQPDGAVHAAAADGLAVRVEGDLGDAAIMTDEAVELPTGPDIPEAHRTVRTAAARQFPVRT